MAEINEKDIVIRSIDKEQVCVTCGFPKGKGEQGDICACDILNGLPLVCELAENTNKIENNELRM